jgi:protein-S-isoprenylcysteine O-methyltransferase Ste14
MYSGALLMLSGVPVALGSWWGLLLMIPFTAIIAWRLHEEEIFLIAELPGYSSHRQKVKYRLLPFVW